LSTLPTSHPPQEMYAPAAAAGAAGGAGAGTTAYQGVHHLAYVSPHGGSPSEQAASPASNVSELMATYQPPNPQAHEMPAQYHIAVPPPAHAPPSAQQHGMSPQAYGQELPNPGPWHPQ